jgi:hypothetical protein
MRDGQRIGARSGLEQAQARFGADLAELPKQARRIKDPVGPQPVLSAELARLAQPERSARCHSRRRHGWPRGVCRRTAGAEAEPRQR